MKNSRPILSICIPTYNRAELLKYSLKSIIPQVNEFSDEVELIVSDNGSDDHTIEVVKWAQQMGDFKFHRNIENLGVIKNIFKLTHELSSGEYCWVLGDDDMLVNGKLGKILDCIKTYSEIDYFFVNFFGKSVKERNVLIDNFDSKYSPKFKEYFMKDLDDKVLDTWEEILGIKNTLPAQSITFIGCHIFRRQIWNKYTYLIKQHINNGFSTLEATFPHNIILTHAMKGKPSYYIGDPCVLFGTGAHEWSKYLTKIELERVEELIQLYEQIGIDKKLIKYCKDDFLKRSAKNVIRTICDEDKSEIKVDFNKLFNKYGSKQKFYVTLMSEMGKKLPSRNEEVFNNFTNKFFETILRKYIKKNSALAIWGGGEIGLSLLESNLILDHLKVVIDKDKTKINKNFGPTHIKIQSPSYLLENPVDVILVASLKYAKEIIKEIKNEHNFKSEIISVFDF
ncbi:glycosyltransferase [Fodinisporobacter ferrooxydans]|uniref:Glycosyltransferase n=1 Tax=Fodinisporobacter ferrooxydans TaxID=2901836 RepID=A0ABY4CLK7_9BACL|nr:glycosyltransferase [Alicyclobacillaceae bacterium MYW30-H2]